MKGISFADLSEYLIALTHEGYPAERIVQSVCTCGGKTFRLHADPNEGCARRKCSSCDEEKLIADSHDYWDEAEPEPCICLCGESTLELGVAFSLRKDGEVRWITVGQRCTSCGILGSPVDWKIDYSPTDHLIENA